MSGPTSSIPVPKKRADKRILIVVAVLVVSALLAVVVLGGLLNNNGGEEKNVLEKIRERGKLIVGTNVPWAPFEYYNETSAKYEGFDVDVITKVAQSIGVDVEFRTMEFDALFGAVQSGEIDVAISSISIRPDLAQSVDFSTPYYTADQAVLVRNSSTITNMNDLNGTVVGAVHDTTGLFLVNNDLSATSRSFQNYGEAALALENQQENISAVILDTPIANRYAVDPSYHLKVAFVIPTNEQYGIAVQKGQTELTSTIDDTINSMKADGSLETMMDRWF